MEDSKQLIINQWHLGYVNLSLRYFVFLQYTMLKPPWICLHETAAKFCFNMTMRRMVKLSTSNQYILISFYWDLWNEEISEITIGKYSQITFEN